MSSVDYSQRRMNQLVDRYVTTELPLHEILRDASKPRHPVVQVLLRTEEAINGLRPAKEALASASSTPMSRCDSELLVLTLSSWAHLACIQERPSEADALIQRAKQQLSDATHPEVRAVCMRSESILADTTGNKHGRETILRALLELLPPYSLRRKYYQWDLIFHLAQQGRASEMETDLKSLSWQSSEYFKMNRILAARFVDSVETGQLQDASHLLSELVSDLHQNTELGRICWRYQALLKLMQKTPIEARVDPQSSERLPSWLRIPDHLASGRAPEALAMARAEAAQGLNPIFGTGFDSFNLIRAELASGAWEGARRLLQLRESRGNRHYLDSFFWTRIELLSDNTKASARHFADLLRSVERYAARGRLDYELRLASELSHGDIVQLTRSAEKSILRNQKKRLKTQPDGSVEEEPELTSPPRRGIDLILGRGPSVTSIKQSIMRFADIDTAILITGETGTGKELVAQALHEMSSRKNEPFIPVDCGAITETLLESELFGHERGAYTGADKTTKGLFEEAGKGTIFLDEIGDISPRLQSALLRVLETNEIRAVGSSKPRKVKCRMLAATNADLPEFVEEKKFRADLLFRLQRLSIHLPPLRERKEDLLLLTRHFLDLGRNVGSHAKIARDLQNALKGYDWPGNVRELRNVIERMRLLHSDKLFYSMDDLDSGLGSEAPTYSEPIPAEEQVAYQPQPTAPPPPLAPQPVGFEQVIKGGRSQIRRIDRLKELFAEYKKLTRSEVIKISGVSPNTATKDLKALCDEGIIERIEPSASTRSHYFVLKAEE